MSGREQLVPRDLVYPPDKSKDEIDKANNEDFKQSEDNAEYAALGYLKYPPAVTVETVSKDGPSAGKLQDGDAIDAVERQAGDQPRPVHRDPEEDQAGPGGRRRLPPQERTARHRRPSSCGDQPGPRLRLPGRRRAGRAVGAVQDRLQPRQHRRPVGGTDVQPGRHRQADHRRPQRRRSSSRAPAPSPPTARSARSAASPTRWWPPTRPARRCSWCPPTTATRPKSAHEDGLELIKVETPRRGPWTR